MCKQNSRCAQVKDLALCTQCVQQRFSRMSKATDTIASLRAEVSPLPSLRAELAAWKTAVETGEARMQALTRERDEALENSKDALKRAAERDDVLARFGAAAEERAALVQTADSLERQLADAHALLGERDRAARDTQHRIEEYHSQLDEGQRRNAKLTREWECAIRQHDAAKTRLDALQQELDDCATQKMALTREKLDAVQARHALQAQLTDACATVGRKDAELDALREERDATVSATDAAYRDALRLRDAAANERETAVAARDEVTRRLADVSRALDDALKERDALKATTRSPALTKAVLQAYQHCADLVKERDAAVGELKREMARMEMRRVEITDALQMKEVRMVSSGLVSIPAKPAWQSVVSKSDLQTVLARGAQDLAARLRVRVRANPASHVPGASGLAARLRAVPTIENRSRDASLKRSLPLERAHAEGPQVKRARSC